MLRSTSCGSHLASLSFECEALTARSVSDSASGCNTAKQQGPCITHGRESAIKESSMVREGFLSRVESLKSKLEYNGSFGCRAGQRDTKATISLKLTPS